MKALTAAMILAIGTLAAGQALATDAGTCYTITDQDHRNLCRAKAHKDPGICYAIQRGDIRSACLAETRK